MDDEAQQELGEARRQALHYNMMYDDSSRQGGTTAAAAATLDENTMAMSNNNNNATSSSSPPPPPPSSSLGWTESLMPGMGLLGESYMLFSVGTLQPIWQLLFADNNNSNNSNSNSSSSKHYYLARAVVLGIISGMLGLGYLANTWGRQRLSVATAALMATGALGLTLSSMCLVQDDNDNNNFLFSCLTACFVVFGIGVGGEYPLSAASASERAMAPLKSADTAHAADGLFKHDETKAAAASRQRQRGQQIQLVFSMQGVGIFLNCLVLTLLLVLTGTGHVVIAVQQQQGNNNNNEQQQQRASLLAIWRITYAIGTVILCGLLYYRVSYLQESTIWQQQQQPAPAQPQLPQETTRSRQPTPEIPLTPSGISMVSTVSSLSAPSLAVRHVEDHDDDDDDEHDHENDHDNCAHCHSSYYWQQQQQDDDEHYFWSSSTAVDATTRTTPQPTTMRLLWRNYYGVRLLGASLCWLLWDVSFYGNKLFQSTFLLALTGDETTLLEFALAATLNAAVALLGYWGAALLVDRVGRRRLQQYGFLLTGALFVSCGFLYQTLSSAALVTLYLGSSFFGQLGPNATTFMIPAEIFPTHVRTFCHGVAAASGKLGALLAAVAFDGVLLDDELDMFLLAGYAAFCASAVTFWTIPETAGLDLHELDQQWRLGRHYQGPALHPRFLSYYERRRLLVQQRQDHNEDDVLPELFHAMD